MQVRRLSSSLRWSAGTTSWRWATQTDPWRSVHLLPSISAGGASDSVCMRIRASACICLAPACHCLHTAAAATRRLSLKLFANLLLMLMPMLLLLVVPHDAASGGVQRRRFACSSSATGCCTFDRGRRVACSPLASTTATCARCTPAAASSGGGSRTSAFSRPLCAHSGLRVCT